MSNNPRLARRRSEQRVGLALAVVVLLTLALLPLALSVATAPALETRAIRIMPLGDSLTEGNYPNQIHSYRGYLRAKLLANGYTNIDFVGDRLKQAHGDASPLDLNHAGHGGYTIGPDTYRFCDTCETTGLYEHIAAWLAVSNPDIILLLIGMNDLVAADNHPPNYAQTAPDRLEQLVERIQCLQPNATILLSSLLETRESTEGWYKYDAVNLRAASIGNADAHDNVLFVDLNAIELEDEDFSDNVHLVESGARKVANGWYDALAPLLAPLLPTPTPAPTATLDCPPGQQVALAAGWNLVSLPATPPNTDPLAVFCSIADRLVSAFTYHESPQGSNWRIYSPAMPAYARTLTWIDETMGIWVQVDAACTWVCPGSTTSGVTIPLHAGWNLVGYPLATSQPVAQGLASIEGQYRQVYAWDPTTPADPWRVYDVESGPEASSLKTLDPAHGYWILTTEGCMLTY